MQICNSNTKQFSRVLQWEDLHICFWVYLTTTVSVLPVTIGAIREIILFPHIIKWGRVLLIENGPEKKNKTV